MAITSAAEYAARHAALVAGLARLVDDYVPASDKRSVRAHVAALVEPLGPSEFEAAPPESESESEPEPAAQTGHAASVTAIDIPPAVPSGDQATTTE